MIHTNGTRGQPLHGENAAPQACPRELPTSRDSIPLAARTVALLILGSLTLGSLTLAAAGCSKRELTLVDLNRRMAVAVSPALNHSGSEDFDPLRVADLMASELAQLPGIEVIPLNRVLAQLAADGAERIESPGHALEVMKRVGADAIVVLAVTEYDPYWPPILGISAQLYGYGPRSPGGFDPVEASRRASPVETGADSDTLRAQYQRVFNGEDESVVYEIKRFARRRDADHSPFGWRKFLASQEKYIRFCCATTARELIQQEVTQVVALSVRQNEVERP